MGTFFRQCICTMFALVWCYDKMPVDWVSSQVCTFDNNFKAGCEEVRVINSVGEIGKRYVEHLLQSWKHRWTSMYASGYQLGGLRVEAAIHQWDVAHQESQEEANFVGFSKDAKNVFANHGHDQQDEDFRAGLQSYRDMSVVFSIGQTVCSWSRLGVKHYRVG